VREREGIDERWIVSELDGDQAYQSTKFGCLLLLCGAQDQMDKSRKGR
jgi:hypothetical protein